MLNKKIKQDRLKKNKTQESDHVFTNDGILNKKNKNNFLTACPYEFSSPN